ncbi:PREDICTED: nucleolar complex protein 3 homolog [Papilio polytes]|uniref:nucleolar complex protein 3 homolog n=1 Tax=Papilio polytes TaxID=76194 RepID=UPI0006765691|nr:PREDICTED: nucleolar complex protein 3 homolog [Papilio polytes]
MAKKGKVKISKVKRNNQTTNKMRKQGKLRLQRHRNKAQKQRQPTQTQEPIYSSDSDAASGDEWADMLDEEEQKYILGRIAKQPNLLSNIPEENKKEQKKPKKRKITPEHTKNALSSDSGAETETDNSDVEEKYEAEMAERPAKKLRPLLPIKTKDGILERSEECEDTDSDEEQPDEVPEPSENKEESQDSDSGMEVAGEELEGTDEVVTAVQLLAARRDKLKHEKLRIGALCSSLLENPERKLKNLYPILYLMDEHLKDGTPNLVSVRKLASVSAAEVFRDILPDYAIRHQDYSDVKLKKDTLALYKYEKELLEFYKRYLQRLEKAASVMRRKKGDNRQLEESETSLALVSLRCLCALLQARPQFNYAGNIAQTVLPYLASRRADARDTVTQCCQQVFTDDNKGEITLKIVKLINHLVKKRGTRLHPGALECLLALRIRDVDLDAEADLKHKKKQEEKHKKRIVNLSKKEKKRAKKLKEVERELLETEAREDSEARKKQLTEVTKTVFNIYFRILKTAPNSQLLEAVLTGLAKFSHVINVEYYSELVSLLSRLCGDGEASAGLLGRRARLQCARAALAVLAAAGDALNFDPAHFHAQLYANAINVHAGGTCSEARIVLEAACEVCARARRVSPLVLRALAKRLATLALQAAPHAALAALHIVCNLMQSSSSLQSLLEPEDASGAGRYDAQCGAPAQCGAQAAVLHELAALRRHYQPALRQAAGTLLARAAPLHKSPMHIYDEYDGSQMSFKPAITPPARVRQRPAQTAHSAWAQRDFKLHCEAVEDTVQLNILFA